MKRSPQYVQRYDHWAFTFFVLVFLISMIMQHGAQAFQPTSGLSSSGMIRIEEEDSSTLLFAVASVAIRRQYNNQSPAYSRCVDTTTNDPRGGVTKQATTRRRQRRKEEYAQHLHTLDRCPVLVLNADYRPLSYLPLCTWNWQEAIKAVFSGKVTVVEKYPDVVIRAASLEIPLPSVIALNDYQKRPLHSKPAFTRRNVFVRDQYKCQYCSHEFPARDLSLDHVMPRSMGGTLCWENTVTSCRTCNGKKGSLTVNELERVNMRLLREPYTPTHFQLHAAGMPKRFPSAWLPYLGLLGSSSE